MKDQWTKGWADTIFRSSYRIAMGKSQNNYDRQFDEYGIQRKYQHIRRKLLVDQKYKALLLNEKTVPKDFPALYNKDLLYRDDFLFDFIIENSYIKTGENDLAKSFNSYRKLRNERNYENDKVYNGNGNFKQEEIW